MRVTQTSGMVSAPLFATALTCSTSPQNHNNNNIDTLPITHCQLQEYWRKNILPVPIRGSCSTGEVTYWHLLGLMCRKMIYVQVFLQDRPLKISLTVPKQQWDWETANTVKSLFHCMAIFWMYICKAVFELLLVECLDRSCT